MRLLAKALAVSPQDWETRAHLISAHFREHRLADANALIQAAPAPAEIEAHRLAVAEVQVESDQEAALATLTDILQANRGCARAYLYLARLYLKRGLTDEARRKYGAATVIDPGLADPALDRALNLPPAPKEAALPVASEGAAELPTAEEISSAMAALQEGDLDVSRTTFADVGGMEEVIERIRMTIIYPFKNPALFQKYKKRPGGGILLYGPPGCGKTHIARATAGECGAPFISVAITDVLSKWLGESERHLHELFETARRRAPAVVFIDEIDAIGVARSDAGASMAPLVNVLLTELDGIGTRNENVLVLAATNLPWRVDSALRRPGRFDRVVFVPPPDEPAREAILRLYLADLPAEALDLAGLARQTERFSGADLRAVVERATDQMIQEEMRKGPGVRLTQKLLLATIKNMRPSTGEWLETARNYASYGNRSGLYDDLAAYLEGPGR